MSYAYMTGIPVIYIIHATSLSQRCQQQLALTNLKRISPCLVILSVPKEAVSNS